MCWFLGKLIKNKRQIAIGQYTHSEATSSGWVISSAHKMTDNMLEESENAKENRTFTATTAPQPAAGLTLPPSHPISFGSLVKQAFPTVWRNRKQMYFLYAFYVTMAILLGTTQNGVGDGESNVMNNIRCIFYTIASTTFIGMLPTIVTRK